MVTVRGRRTCRVNIAGVVCFRPGQQPHLLYERLVYHGRKREPKSSTWSGYRDLIVATHRPAASNRNRYRRSCSAGVYPPLCAYRMPRPYTR
ncbi:hypothetical protein [Nonomuraea bangladeshensis]|uniref:hypothetical protein n=1 Tax=Nonomuraea bangladeshensis TaxID=404385 RepID=UPI003C2C8F62